MKEKLLRLNTLFDDLFLLLLLLCNTPPAPAWSAQPRLLGLAMLNDSIFIVFAISKAVHTVGRLSRPATDNSVSCLVLCPVLSIFVDFYKLILLGPPGCRTDRHCGPLFSRVPNITICNITQPMARPTTTTTKQEMDDHHRF